MCFKSSFMSVKVLSNLCISSYKKLEKSSIAVSEFLFVFCGTFFPKYLSATEVCLRCAFLGVGIGTEPCAMPVLLAALTFELRGS